MKKINYKELKYIKYIFIFHFLLSLILANAQQWPKIWDSKKNTWSTWESVHQAMSEAKIVFVGEQHNHVWGHKIEEKLLKDFWEIHGDIALGLEMFERDVQHLLDGYLAGEITEKFFLSHSRPWPNYMKDYRPMVEFARSLKFPVLALNVPRRYASMVAKGQEDSLAKLPSFEKKFLASKIYAPQNRYWEKFQEIMKNHTTQELINFYYRAQCLKDDTMAESIIHFFRTYPYSHLICYAGSFHCEEYLGIVERVQRQKPDWLLLVISIIPITNIPKKPQEYSHLADFILFAPGN